MKALEWWDRQSPIHALAIVLGVFGLAALIAAVGRVPQTQPTTSFIYVLTTPQPTAPMPTADMRLAEENAALRARVAELEAQNPAPVRDLVDQKPDPDQHLYQVMAQPEQPTEAPEPGYTAQTDQGPVFVPNDATKVPEDKPYTGPFLQPQLPTPSGVRVCTGFHDWRDFDAAYEASPVCHQP